MKVAGKTIDSLNCYKKIVDFIFICVNINMDLTKAKLILLKYINLKCNINSR